MTDLDGQIVAASSLVSVLLVFVFAYFSAVLPTIEELRARPRPAADDDRLIGTEPRSSGWSDSFSYYCCRSRSRC